MTLNTSYYVYALIDPQTQIPFYIGKGVNNRAIEHFRIGEDIHEIGIDSNESPAKTARIADLFQSGYGREDMIRVLAKNLSEKQALAIEALLIKHVYGLDALTNQVKGAHDDRFRALNDWQYIAGYDLPFNDRQGGFIGDPKRHASGAYYVYALIDPENKQPFYVGKGQKDRLQAHFKEAAHASKREEKHIAIRRCTAKGYTAQDIGRIIARVDSEELAFLIESFYIKFVVGFSQLGNIQPGVGSDLFRSRGDWELRKSLDLPILIEPGAFHKTLYQQLLGERVDWVLFEAMAHIQAQRPELALRFSEPAIIGAGELAILASLPGIHPNVKLRLQIRSARRIQVMLCPIGQEAKSWVKTHFTRFNAFPLKRKDLMFIPDPWWGAKNVTPDPMIAAERALQLIDLAYAREREQLRYPELLEALPHVPG